MSDTKLRSIRFPADLSEAVEDACRETGLSFNAYVVATLRSHLSQTAAGLEWLESVRLWLLATYRPAAFPQDVTRLVFHYIRDTPSVRKAYEEMIRSEDGELDRCRRVDLHKQVGRMVKEALQAEVIGRAVDLDPAEHLIRSHSLLRPTGWKRDESEGEDQAHG